MRRSKGIAEQIRGQIGVRVGGGGGSENRFIEQVMEEEVSWDISGG